MAVRVRVAGSGTLVAWKVPWPDVFLTDERLLSAVSPLGAEAGMQLVLTGLGKLIASRFPSLLKQRIDSASGRVSKSGWPLSFLSFVRRPRRCSWPTRF